MGQPIPGSTAGSTAASTAATTPSSPSSGSSGGGLVEWNNMLSAYSGYSGNVSNEMQNIAKMTAGGVQMTALFNLQMQMNVLTMFGSTITNVMSGIQSVAMSVTHNLKGQ